jgi:GNAT superfamily N-acetyltransferase
MPGVRISRTGELSWIATAGDLTAATATGSRGSGPESCFLRLAVDPRWQRLGVGRELAAVVLADLRRAGWATAEAIAAAGTPGEDFARRLGAAVDDELIRATAQFAELDRDDLRSLSVPAADYEITIWSRQAPDALVASYAAVKRRIADAPNRHPPQVPDWTADLVRASERERERRGRALWVAAAVPAGRAGVAAFTEIELSATSAEAAQSDTVVLREHRRRGLATAVKARLLLTVQESRPDLVSISLTCAAANTAMRAVNTRLGFGEVERRTLFRLTL